MQIDMMGAVALAAAEPTGVTGPRLRPDAYVSGTAGKMFVALPTASTAIGPSLRHEIYLDASTDRVISTEMSHYSFTVRLSMAVALSFVALSSVFAALSFVPGIGSFGIPVAITALIAGLVGSHGASLARVERRNAVQ